MLNPIELKFKVDKDSKTVFRTEKTIASHDINSVEFHISFDGLELTDTHIVKVLTSFHSSKSQTNVECEIVDGKAIYKPDTSLISRYEQVTCYIYVYHGNQSLAVRDFTYSVDVSKIDETTIRVREVYDQSYARVLLDFEQALQNYKDALPQADSVRAEIDVVLNQFGVDSQAKLNQYDADAQQAIADNQTAFDLAETGRQNTYEQAENNRNQASSQALADWEQGADAIIEIVETNELERVDVEAIRKTAETDRVSSEATRKTNETTRISNENIRKSAEVIRLASEVDRVNAESVRSEFYDSFESDLGKKANKQQEAWITPTLLNGAVGTIKYRKNEFGRIEFIGSVNYPTDGNKPFLHLPSGYHTGDQIRFSITSIDGVISNVLIFGNTMIFPKILANKTVNLSCLSFIV